MIMTERSKVDVLEMKCLRRLVGVSQIDGVGNEEVGIRAGTEMELARRADQRVLRGFGRLERMEEYRFAIRVLMMEVGGCPVRGRPRLGWMDGMKVALGNRGLTVEAPRQYARDWKKWSALVHMLLKEFHVTIFAWPCVLSDRLDAFGIN